MNEEIIARQGGLGGEPIQNVAQQSQGLGQIAPKNSSLELFELANKEKQKAKEMQYETEVMAAKAAQQDFANKQSNLIDNTILEALKNRQIDEQMAHEIFQDPRVGDIAKRQVADAFYPARNVDRLNFGDEENRASAVNLDNTIQERMPNMSDQEMMRMVNPEYR